MKCEKELTHELWCLNKLSQEELTWCLFLFFSPIIQNKAQNKREAVEAMQKTRENQKQNTKQKQNHTN